jgi:large repetitive protein
LTTGSALAYTLTATDLAGNVTTANPTVTIETYASVVLGTSGLIGYWRLGETSGTTAADEKAANPGIYWPGSAYTLGQPDPLAGDPNGAVDLDGVTGFAYVPDSAAVKPTAAVSIEAWIKPDSLTGTRWIVVKDTFYYLYIADGSVIFGVATTTLGYQYATTTAVTTGSWQHLVGSYDGVTAKLYRNGVEVASSPASGPIATGTGALYFGVYGPPASGYYDGDLDEIALYGSGLSAATVSDHYQSGRGS